MASADHQAFARLALLLPLSLVKAKLREPQAADPVGFEPGICLVVLAPRDGRSIDEARWLSAGGSAVHVWGGEALHADPTGLVAHFAARGPQRIAGDGGDGALESGWAAERAMAAARAALEQAGETPLRCGIASCEIVRTLVPGSDRTLLLHAGPGIAAARRAATAVTGKGIALQREAWHLVEEIAEGHAGGDHVLLEAWDGRVSPMPRTPLRLSDHDAATLDRVAEELMPLVPELARSWIRGDHEELLWRLPGSRCMVRVGRSEPDRYECEILARWAGKVLREARRVEGDVLEVDPSGAGDSGLVLTLWLPEGAQAAAQLVEGMDAAALEGMEQRVDCAPGRWELHLEGDGLRMWPMLLPAAEGRAA